LLRLIPFASVKENGTRETSSSVLKRRARLSPEGGREEEEEEADPLVRSFVTSSSSC